MNLLARLIPKKDDGFVPMTVALGAMSPFWAIEPQRADALFAALERVDFRTHAEEFARMQAGSYIDNGDDRHDALYEVDGSGIATICITGALTKRPTSWGGGCSTVVLRQAVRKAVKDPLVTAIALLVDSPGGNIEGIEDAASDIFAARGSKPIGAYVEDCGCSAAYWLLSQADFVWCNPSALVGSTGTKTYLQDSSEYYKKMGVRNIPVMSAPLKGIVPGTVVSADQVADVQRIVNEINDRLLGAVRRGRGMTAEQLAAISDTRVHVGQNAVAYKLCDRVATIDQFYAKLGGGEVADKVIEDEADEAEECPDDDPDELNDDEPDDPGTTALSGQGAKTMSILDTIKAALTGAGIKCDDDVPAAEAAAAAVSPVATATMAELQATARLYSEHIADLRAEGKRCAIIAHGQDIGAEQAAIIDAMAPGKALAGYVANLQRQARLKAPEAGSTRTTSASGTVATATDADGGEPQAQISSTDIYASRAKAMGR